MLCAVDRPAAVYDVDRCEILAGSSTTLSIYSAAKSHSTFVASSVKIMRRSKLYQGKYVVPIFINELHGGIQTPDFPFTCTI
jgi:hypothetical protein